QCHQRLLRDRPSAGGHDGARYCREGQGGALDFYVRQRRSGDRRASRWRRGQGAHLDGLHGDEQIAVCKRGARCDGPFDFGGSKMLPKAILRASALAALLVGLTAAAAAKGAEKVDQAAIAKTVKAEVAEQIAGINAHDPVKATKWEADDI